MPNDSSLSAISSFLAKGKPTLQQIQEDPNLIRTMLDVDRTPEVCLATVSLDGHLIRHLTKAQRSPEVITAAVRQKGYAIKHLSTQERTPELWMIALTSSRFTIEHLEPQDVKQPGAEELHEYLGSHWEQFVNILGEARATEIGKAILETRAHGADS